MSYNFLDKTGLAYFWGKIKDYIAKITRNDLAVITSKEYSGIYGSANDQAGASFYYGTVRPNNFYEMWRIKFRVYSNVLNQNEYKQYSEVEYYGNKSDIGYVIFNRISNSNGRCFYYNNVCRLNLTGYNAGYSHILGVGLRNSSNPTSSSYPRYFKIELLETENCAFTFYDSMKKIDNISEYSTTNYTGIGEYDAGNNGLRETGDDTNIWQLRHNSGNFIVSTALYRYMLCLQKNETTLIPINAVNNSTATTKALTTDAFNPFGQIVFYNSTTTINANSSVGASALFEQITFDLRYSFNTGTTLTAHKDVYMVAVPQSNGMAKLHSTPITQILPTSENGLIYIHLGRAYSGYQIELYPVHPIYQYKNGSLRLYVNVSEEGVPTGSINMFAGQNAPNGYLICDGSAISRETYANLFNVIGTLYGEGDGSTTFNIPKIEGCIPVGLDENDTDFDTLGKTGGEKTHTLTASEMPEHIHTGIQVTNPKLSYYEYIGLERLNATGWTSGSNNSSVGAYQYANYNGFTGKFNASASKTGSAGEGQEHNNMQPYIVLNYIIKT